MQQWLINFHSKFWHRCLILVVQFTFMECHFCDLRTFLVYFALDKLKVHHISICGLFYLHLKPVLYVSPQTLIISTKFEVNTTVH